MSFGTKRHSLVARVRLANVIPNPRNMMKAALPALLSAALLAPGIAMAQSPGCNAINMTARPLVLNAANSTQTVSIGGLATTTNFNPGEVISYSYVVSPTGGVIGARVNYQVVGGPLTNLVGGNPATGYEPANGSGSFTAPANLARFTFSANGNTGGATGAGTVSYTLSCALAPPPVPAISSISPTFGPSEGGTSVTINGTDLSSATVVFGSTAGAIISNSATQIVATAPAGTGTVDVRVTTANGTSANTAADDYRYSQRPAAPVVTAPGNGASTGTIPTYTGTAATGTTITIFVDGASIGTTTAGSGAWSRVQPSALSAGSHTVYATATNSDGLVSANSATNSFTVAAAPVASNYTAPVVPYNPGGGAASSFSIAGQATNSPTSYAVGSATTANGGSVSINASGLVAYTPPAAFRGNDSFTYTATNAGGTSAPATVTVPVGNPALSASLSGSGTRGAALSNVRIVASGGTAPYSCGTTVASGALPAGTSLNPDCSITGTPGASGTFSFTANITDSSTPAFTQASGPLTLTVTAPSLALTPAAGALPGATAGASYSQTFTASGGTAPFNYARTAGTLPAGLTLSAGGTLSGTSTEVGTYSFTVTATDSSTAGSGGPYTASNSYSVTVTAPTITLTPPALPNGATGAAYTASVSASGGTAPYSYAVTAGTLPAGLTLTSGGAISGTPSAGGTFNFTISATDGTTGAGAPYRGSQAYTVTIGAPTITVSPATLTAATVGTGYNATITASGGTPGYSYAVTAGALPAGVTLATGGTLSGTPTAAGSFNFTVTATDSSSGAGPYAGSRAYTLAVNPPVIAVAPATLPNATAGVAYSQSVTASGGTGGYTYAVTAGALPAGLTLASNGTLAGTATTGGTFNFTITATDSSTGTGAPYQGSRGYSLTVAPATVVVTPTSLPDGRAGAAYNQTITASGGNGSYSYAITAGALPPGWTLSASGVLSGTSTASDIYNFTVTATDQSTGTGAPYSGSRAYSVTVGSPAFTLTPPTLNAVVGQTYTGNFVAGGGTAPYTYTRAGGTLPTGLTLAADGTLSGTPTASGTFNFTVIARDSTTGTGSPYGVGSGYTFTVAAPALSLSPATLANGAVGAAYNQTVSASGGATPYSYAVTAGALPAGLSLNAASGVIGGTPTASGTFNFTLTATDSSTGAGAPFTAGRAYSLTIAPATIAITPTTLPSGTPGAAYSQALTASGGTAPYVFAITSGTLPAGLSLNAGIISGTPTTAGSFNFTVTATDSSTGAGAPYSTSLAYTLTIGSATVVVDTTTLPNATVASGYSQTITASGGVGPYSYAVTAGALPAGVTLSSSGILSGSPTAGGSFTFTVTAIDASAGSGPFSGSRSLTLLVDAPTIALTPTTLPAAGVGAAYSQTLGASGGTGTYSFAVTAGALPAGITLSPTGELSGTPSAGGTFNFTVAATDSSTGAGPYSGSTAYSLTVGTPTLALSPATLAPAATGVAYNATISASGGTAPYSYAVSAGALPAGITLAADGALSGAPTAGGSFAFTVTATDSSSGAGAPYTASRAYTLTVSAATIALSPAALPDGRMGAAYNATISASGGIAPYGYAITAGALPAGMTLSATGALSGTPGAAGTFDFTVTATDSSGGAGPYAAARAYALVIAAPDVPVAGPVDATVAFGSSGNTIAPVLSGGTATGLTIATAPAHGTATVNGLTLAYTPAPGYAGADSFTYAATNAGGTSASATVSVQVTAPPAPTAADVSNVAIAYGSGGTAIDLSATITGVRTGVTIATSPAHGTATIAGEVVTYVPAAGYFGSDSFTYTATGPGGTSTPASVTLQIATPPAPTVANVPNVAVPYGSGGTGIDLSAAITGVRTGVTIATSPAHGTATIAGEVVTYVPAAGYFGSDSFTYTATGPGGTSAPATVTIQVAVPPAPTAASRSGVAIAHDSAGTAIDLSSDIVGVFTSIAIITTPGNGTATISGAVVTYTPNAGYYGADRFTYAVTGPGGTSAPATVELSVAPPPPPQAGNGAGSVPASTSTTGTQSVDVDLSTLITGNYDRIEIQGQPSNGTVILRGNSSPAERIAAVRALAGPRVIATYTPATGFVGTDSFSFVAVGPGGTSAPASVAIRVIGQAPVAQPKTAAIGDGQLVSVILTDGASEGPFTGATVVGLTPTDQATATIVASGSGSGTAQQYRLDVTSAARFGGTIVVTYTLANAYGVSAPSTVTVTVTARPDPSADPNVRAISDAQAETTRRFARSQVANFMRRTEQLHGNGGGSGGANIGLTLNSRDGRGLAQMPPSLDASALEITERMHRSSAEDPAWSRMVYSRNGMGFDRSDPVAMATAATALTAADRNAARKASGMAGEVQPLAQDAAGNTDGTRRIGSVGVWSGGAIDIGTQDATTDRSKITATTSGLSAGADIKLAAGLTVGIGGGYGNDLSRIDGGAARIRAESTMGALYASVTPLDDLFVDGLIGRGDLNFRTRRRVAGGDAVALGDRDGDFTVAALALGIDRQGDRFSWSLYGRGETLDAKLGAYTETGADRLNLRFDERKLTSVTGTLGARIEFKQRYTFGTLMPRVRAEWNHEFADTDAQRLDYADIPGSALYGIETQGWSREQFQLSLGTRFLLPSLWTFDLETGFRGASGQRSGSIRAQITKEF